MRYLIILAVLLLGACTSREECRVRASQSIDERLRYCEKLVRLELWTHGFRDDTHIDSIECHPDRDLRHCYCEAKTTLGRFDRSILFGVSCPSYD